MGELLELGSKGERFVVFDMTRAQIHQLLRCSCLLWSRSVLFVISGDLGADHLASLCWILAHKALKEDFCLAVGQNPTVYIRILVNTQIASKIDCSRMIGFIP